ncbi:hypothetical protein KO525_06430 [Psychrosphaera sp. B3R10]|nr:hypothetical protein [Psychrosphaera sp. I2R16]MBU2989013.1 hypothetical protein [Psychrosphaera sp. B3R10]
MEMLKVSLTVSKKTLDEFDDLLIELGLTKQWWASTLLLNEAFYLLWPFKGLNTFEKIEPNSNLGLLFLEKRQYGKEPLDFGVDRVFKDTRRTQFLMAKSNRELLTQICESFNVSESALFEFAMNETLLKAGGGILKYRNQEKYRPLFTGSISGSGLTEFEELRQNLSEKLKKIQSITLEPLAQEDKLNRLKEALFIPDGLVPKSFKKKHVKRFKKPNM